MGSGEIFGMLHGLAEQLSVITDAISVTTNSEAREVGSQLSLGIESVKLAMFYLEEAQRCLVSQAYFASGAFGAAALEAMLLTKCAMSKSEVTSLPSYAMLPPKLTRDYTTFLLSQDLGKLLQIAEQLKWLNVSDIPHYFELMVLKQVEPSVASIMRDMISSMKSIGDEAGKYAKLYRNGIHPASCIRQDLKLDKSSGLAGCTFVLLAIAALVEAARRS